MLLWSVFLSLCVIKNKGLNKKSRFWRDQMIFVIIYSKASIFWANTVLGTAPNCLSATSPPLKNHGPHHSAQNRPKQALPMEEQLHQNLRHLPLLP